jgi:hypothetical protein
MRDKYDELMKCAQSLHASVHITALLSLPNLTVQPVTIILVYNWWHSLSLSTELFPCLEENFLQGCNDTRFFYTFREMLQELTVSIFRTKEETEQSSRNWLLVLFAVTRMRASNLYQLLKLFSIIWNSHDWTGGNSCIKLHSICWPHYQAQ